MTEAPATSVHGRRLDLLDAVIYADVFDCAVTLDELWRYSRTELGREALVINLREDPFLAGIVLERGGFYCLYGREDLVAERPARIERARRLERRARRVARVVRHLPFIRGLALTGSAAARDAGEGADADMLVVVAEERLGMVFFMLASASRLLGRRILCPNYYVREGLFPPGRGNLYQARELAQARNLLTDAPPGRDGLGWVNELLPNARVQTAPESCRATRVQRLLERSLRGRLGDRLERAGRRVALARLRAHHGGAGERVPPEVREDFVAGRALRFHRGRVEETTLERYRERRAEVARRLEWLAREGARGAA
ncbi:MAG: hypothetical protein ACRDL6_07115 [Solirubrobacterales bacterium]